ncbi:hypothetical protein EBR96_09405 [bacterium]|nr:hypothetical protein [bacterium]
MASTPTGTIISDGNTVGLEDIKSSYDYYFLAIIINLLRQKFRNAEHNCRPMLRHLVYRDGISEGAAKDKPDGLRIEPWDKWTPSTTNTYPIIIGRDGDCASMRLAIGDRHMSPGINNKNGQRVFSRGWAGSLTLFCLSRAPGESKLLAREVADYLEALCFDLRRDLNFHQLQVAKIGATNPLRENPQLLASPVILEYTFIKSWTVQTAAPMLSRIEYVPNYK